MVYPIINIRLLLYNVIDFWNMVDHGTPTFSPPKPLPNPYRTPTEPLPKPAAHFASIKNFNPYYFR